MIQKRSCSLKYFVCIRNNFKLLLPITFMEEEYDYSAYYGEINTKIRDLEEKQRILKDRLLLIGENLLELKEKNTQDILDLKKQIQEIKTSLERIKSFIEIASSEFSNFARKDDLEILTKQAKMFQPLEFVRKSDLEKLKKSV